MSKQKLEFQTGAIGLSYRVVDKLLSQAGGDASLLLLYIYRQNGYYELSEAAKTLRWDSGRTEKALEELERLELVKGPEVEPVPPQSMKEAPQYDAAMIQQEMEAPSSNFPALLDEIERRLGNKLSYQGLQALMELYDYQALPAEVILILVNYKIEEVAYRKGRQVKPKMWEIKREGYHWASKGLDNLDAATAYVKKLEYFRCNEGRILAMVGIRGRTATNREKAFINAWLEMSFEDGVIEMAYEKTLLNTQKWNWNYCNGILKNWNKQGLHTLNEILDAERSHAFQSSGTQKAGVRSGSTQTQQTTADQMDDFQWMQSFVQNYQAGGKA